MACRTEGVRLAGVAACVPSAAADNMETAVPFYGPKAAAMIAATGVKRRHVCPENSLTSLDLAAEAARKLLAAGSFSPESFGAVICLTQTPENLIPNDSTKAQQLLGLPGDCLAFDINASCPGYAQGLYAAALIARSMNKRVLFLNGETSSYYVSPRDRATALLFGDAGAASVIEPCAGAEAWHFSFLTDGSQRGALVIPEGGYRNRVNSLSAEYKTWPDGGTRRPIDMKMDGMAIFNFVVTRVPGLLAHLMEETGVSAGTADYLLLHQANLFMTRQIARKLGFSAEKNPVCLDEYGNTSHVSIPLTMASRIGNELRTKPLTLLLSGFGGGLAASAAVIRTDGLVCPPVAELDPGSVSK